jgi:predicted GIY-YIG superfamily endonuclease
MVTVYALRFDSGSIYVGMTKDLDRRLEEHGRRQSPSTRKLAGDFEVIYQQRFTDYVQARRHEKYLKSGGGRKLLGVRT